MDTIKANQVTGIKNENAKESLSISLKN
jgi:hypothetical protein